jgi:hypothetical protein
MTRRAANAQPQLVGTGLLRVIGFAAAEQDPLPGPLLKPAPGDAFEFWRAKLVLFRRFSIVVNDDDRATCLPPEFRQFEQLRTDREKISGVVTKLKAQICGVDDQNLEAVILNELR